jgi:outer membrane protein OmpA-like peptidoglycan-associated protein
MKSSKSLNTNRRVLAAIAVFLIVSAVLVAIFGVKESKPATLSTEEWRRPAHVLPAKLPPLQIKQLPSGDEVISLNSDVYFAFDSATLTADARSKLQREVVPRVAAVLDRSGARVDVKGYTDGVGDNPYNLTLSQERAEAVRDFLVAAGASSERLEAEGLGEKLTTSSRPDPELRRVDIVLRKGESP